MYLKIVLIFLGIISLVASSSPGLQILLPELHRQYSYVVKTNVSSGTLTPSESVSYWTLDGRLLVQVYDNFTRARFALEDLKTSVYSNNQGYSTYQSAEAANFLRRPWEVDFETTGLVKQLDVDVEPVWATNIKRALTINFQLRKDPGTYTINEPSLYPGTVVTYMVKGNIVKKFSISSPGSISSWSSVTESWRQGYDRTPETIVTAERVYELDERKGLISLDLRGDFQYKINDNILSVISELSLYYDTDTPLPRIEKLNLTQIVFPHYQFHDYSQPSNGIRQSTQHDLKNKTYEILMKIAKKGIDTDNIVKNATLIHSMDFTDLLNTMSQLNYTSLSKLFEEMVLGTSYDLETSRNIFLEVLPHVRSDACAKFVKYLVCEQKEKIEDATILSLIRKLPFNVANHSQALLEELEVFTKLGPDFSQDVRHAGILSFATLVHKSLETWSLKQDYLDNIVVKYFRMYNDCPNYLDRMVWLQGLCNIGYSAASYTGTVYADSTRAPHERLWAALDPGRVNTVEVLESTLPILTDDKEHIQLRIAALHVFLGSSIRASDFLYVHNYINNCNNNQLKRFWYTTVKSLEKTVFNGYRTASYYVPFIINQVSVPDSTYWATNNYIISTKGDSEAASLQVMSVGEALSAVPAFAAIKLNTGGRRPHLLAVYIIAEGVTTNMFKKLHTLDNTEVNVDHLVELLRKMKVKLIQQKKVHIDVVIKVQDQTVYATHINETRFETWNGEDLTKSIEDFLRFGSHINQQLVYYPLQLDINLPTELGTPIRLQSTALSFTSLRGNLTAPSAQDLTWKNDLHIRYQGTSVISLSTAGPLLQSEHIARVQQSIVAHIPLNFDVTLSPITRTFILTWLNPGAQHGGVAMHSRAQIVTESAKGTDVYTINTGDKFNYNANDTSIFFDCERPMSGAELMEKLLSSKSSSYDFINSLHPPLVFMNAFVLLSSPHLGSCGLAATSRRQDEGALRFQLRVEEMSRDLREKGRVRMAHSITYTSNHTGGDVLFNISGYTQFECDHGKTKFEVLMVGNHPHIPDTTRRVWKFCLQEEDTIHSTPDQDITLHPASYEGRLSLTFAAGDNSFTCPAKGSELLVLYRGIPTQVFGELERYFEVKMVGKELPKLELLSRTGLSKTALGQLLGAIDTQQLNLTAIVKEKNGLATVSINRGAELQFKSDNFAWLLDSWSNMQLMKKFGFYRECRLQESTVQTLSGSTELLNEGQCSESLALADCTNSPRFAVLRLKHGGISIYSGFNHVRIEDGVRGIRVIADGKECTDNCEYPVGEPSYNLKITRIGGGVKIISRLSGVQIYYSYIETVILMPHAYLGSACGECAGQQHYQVC